MARKRDLRNALRALVDTEEAPEVTPKAPAISPPAENREVMDTPAPAPERETGPEPEPKLEEAPLQDSTPEEVSTPASPVEAKVDETESPNPDTREGEGTPSAEELLDFPTVDKTPYGVETFCGRAVDVQFARDLVTHLREEGQDETKATLYRRAIELLCQEVSEKLNDGKPIPKRKTDLRQGRRGRSDGGALEPEPERLYEKFETREEDLERVRDLVVFLQQRGFDVNKAETYARAVRLLDRIPS